MNTRPKNPANARNLNACIIGSSGSGKTRFWLTPQLLQAHSSYVCVDPKGGVLSQVGAFLQRRGYKVKVFNSIDFSKSMHYNPLSYIHNEADILKFVDTLIANTKGEGKEGDPFWTKAETLLYCALIAYIIFEAPAEDRNINTLVDMISGMDVKEDDESYFDEFHILLRDALTASYFVAVWKMLRKKGCVPSALTQNVKDLLASREIEAILDNTDFMILLSQAQSDRAILAKQLGISEHQLSYITHSNSGEGLLFYGDVTIPFVDRFPRGEIYNLLTTRPEDLKNEAKAE